MTPLPIELALASMTATLDRIGVPYAVMGGFGVRAWGLPRPTYDADLTISVEQDGIVPLLDALKGEGFEIPEADAKGFLDRIGPFSKFSVLRHDAGTPITIDLFPAHTEFQREAMARRVKTSFGAEEQWVLSREDIVLHKLIAGRRKDLVDVEEILLVAMSVDRQYLRRWAGRLSVEKTLEEALAAASHLE